MGETSAISWTEATWNPVTGCDKVSAGCDHCYAEQFAHRFAGTAAYPNGFAVTLRRERLDHPLRWRRPRRIFVNSMSDLFHPAVPTAYLDEVFDVMERAGAHTFQVLTKRHGRLLSYLQTRATSNGPLPGHIWIGVSVENQKWADIRIPALLRAPALMRFVSAEPLLGPIDLTRAVTTLGSQPGHELTAPFVHTSACCERFHGIDWLIVGGESGSKARPMNIAWAEDLRDQCLAAGTAFHFKQYGARTARALHLTHRAGADPSEWPTTWPREYPQERHDPLHALVRRAGSIAWDQTKG